MIVGKLGCSVLWVALVGDERACNMSILSESLRPPLA